MLIGVLALQGAFIEHERMCQRLSADVVEIRQKKDLDLPIDGLILPGGESTTMLKLLHDLDMYQPIKNKIIQGMPVFGTCAGLILLAKFVDNDPRSFLQVMDIHVKRNAFGRQLGSFYTENEFQGKKIPMTFIRAPYISNVGENVEILSQFDSMIMAARQENMLATAFHPELSSDTTVHQYFIDMIRNRK